MNFQWTENNLNSYSQTFMFMKLAKTLKRLNLTSMLVDYHEKLREAEDEEEDTYSTIEVWVIDENGESAIDEFIDV